MLPDYRGKLVVFPLPMDGMVRPVARGPYLRAWQAIDPDTAQELFVLPAAVAPHLGQLEHTVGRFQVLFAEHHKHAVALPQAPHEFRDAITET
jgi:hypothetical protein